MISIPENIESLIRGKDTTASSNSLNSVLNTAMINERNMILRKKLLEKCLSEYRTYRIINNLNPD